jgi:hypothetical protein
MIVKELGLLGYTISKGVDIMSRIMRKNGIAARVSLRNRPAIRRPLLQDSGVMIIPPPPGSEDEIDADMKRVRQELRDTIGQEAYDKRMQEVNDFFKNISGKEVRS